MSSALLTLLKEDRGNSSVTALIVILTISTLFLSTALLTRSSLERSGKVTLEIQTKTEMDRLVQSVIVELEEDPTPESHSPSDPVWLYLEEDHTPYTLELRDISSRLNINWMRTKLFEETNLSRLIVSGEHPDLIRDRRSQNGFSTDMNDWIETFGEENLEQYFTLYSLANVNVTYEESLELIYRERHGDGGASQFRSKIQQGLSEFKLWDREELPMLLGLGENDVPPVITTIPQMNVHFIDPFLLECLMSYPYREDVINNYLLKTKSILNSRESGELSADELEAIISPTEKQMRILEYLGTQTTFWELVITGEERSESYIIYFNGENWGRVR